MKNLIWNRLLQTQGGNEIHNVVQHCTGNRLNVSYCRLLFFKIKNINVCFNGIQLIDNGNWNVRCAVLMGLLEKNTVIIDLALTGLEGR